MDTSKLDRWEVIGIIASVVLIISLFLEWYTLSSGVTRDESSDWVCGVGHNSCTAFDTFPILRWLLIAAASAPIILAYLVVTDKTLSWPRGEVTAIVGLIAFVLILFNGVIDKPSASNLGISLSFGYFLGLIASIGIFIAGGFRAVDSGGGAPRKPPATF